jgi:hypothetical protein
VYEYKHAKQVLGKQFDEAPKDKIQQAYERKANEKNMKTEDLLDQLKYWGNITEGDRFMGEFAKKERYGTLKDETEVEGRQKKAGKGLRQFANDEEDLSEREDEDIYAHYME